MPAPDIQTLNETFGIGDELRFVDGPGELICAEITNTAGRARIALQGAHIFDYRPTGAEPILFTSKLSGYKHGKAIRGGIPICWPWFNKHPTRPDLPAHGFVRTAPWQVSDSGNTDPETRLTLSIDSNGHTRSLWPHTFRLTATFTIGASLQVELKTINTGTTPLAITSALHTYLAVSDAAAIRITGLEDSGYIDDLDNRERRIQRGPVVIDRKLVHIHTGNPNDCIIDDPGMRRGIRIEKTGAASTIIWNPWVEQAAEMADFDNEEYREMICVESGNVAKDGIIVAPGGEHSMTIRISTDT